MAELHIMSHGGQIALIGRGGVRFLDPKKVAALGEFGADLAQLAADLLDTANPDPDQEPIDEREPDREEGSLAWIERTDQSRHPYGGFAPAQLGADEDAEDDDPREEDGEDTAVDDCPCDEPFMDLEPEHEL